MTGADVRTLRESIGLTPKEFAQLFGVHPSTVYRWEACGGAKARIEPLQSQLMVVTQSFATERDDGGKGMGEPIRSALQVGGPILALCRLLNGVYGKDKPWLMKVLKHEL